MTNDISTLNGALNELGETLADNLSQMGVDDAVASDGLTTLANKILDIEPSVAGLELSTSIDCNVSSNKILLGQSVVFSATLSASYDDTSIEDIDISGVLTGATVLFKTSGGVILGSGVTDVNGVATYTHTFEDMGSIVVHTEFGGSTNFNSCISQNDVTVECSYDFDVTVDKEILSANDNDVATINCRLIDGTGGVVGESIDYRILHNDIVLSSGSRVTNENGEITLEYAATGVGNVDVIFSLRSILQKTYEVEDCVRHDDASSDNTSTYNYNNLNSLTHSTDHYEAYRSIGVESPTSTYYSPIYVDETLPTDFEMSIEFNSNGAYAEQIMLTIGTNHPQSNTGTTELGLLCSSVRRGLFHRVNGSATWYTENKTLSANKWFKYYLKVEGTSVIGKIYDSDNNLLYTTTQTISVAQNYKKWNLIIGGASQTLKWKNLKIKAL